MVRRTGRGVQKGGARAVGSYVPQLTKKVFEKYGFSTADLLTDWLSIVGPEWAAFTSPQRLKWPKAGGSSLHTFGQDGDGGGGRGATLVVRVDGGRALDVQYQSRQIIERINTYFGYRAIDELRLVQGPIAAASGLDGEGRNPVQRPKDVVGRQRLGIPDMKDEGLKAALERLGANVMAESAAKRGHNGQL